MVLKCLELGLMLRGSRITIQFEGFELNSRVYCFKMFRVGFNVKGFKDYNSIGRF
jgi:hypothetical protein